MPASVLSCLRPRKPCDLSMSEATSFCSWLVDELRRLEQSLAKDSVSLKWSIQAMDFLNTMQVELLALFKNSELPISYGAEEDWFHHYMQETATLLDFCNSLKSAVSSINRYRMVVDLAIQTFTKVGSTKIRDVSKSEFERLERVQAKTSDCKGVKETLRLSNGMSTCNRKDDKGISVVMLAAKSAMIVICLFIISAMVSTVSIDVGCSDIGYSFPELQPCFDLLSSIVERFQGRFLRQGETGLVLVEHEMVAEVVRDLKAQLVGGVAKDREKISRGLEMLRTRCNELREGVDMFESMVDKVFDEVIRGRNEMLGILRDEALI